MAGNICNRIFFPDFDDDFSFNASSEMMIPDNEKKPVQ